MEHAAARVENSGNPAAADPRKVLSKLPVRDGLRETTTRRGFAISENGCSLRRCTHY